MSEKCCGRVWDDLSRRHHDCFKPAKYEVDGKHYCGTHNPEAVARRRKKADDKWNQQQRAIVGRAVERQRDSENAAKYLWLRDALYDRTLIIGEARLDFTVVGACPSVEEFDAAIEQQMAEDARYTLTSVGLAEALKNRERSYRGVDENATDCQENAYRAVMQQGAKLNGEVKAGEDKE